jgi:rhomboid protease GluP
VTAAWVVVALEARQRSAEEWSLALGSEGIEVRVLRRPQGFFVEVPADQETAALTLLEAYVRENEPAPPPPPEASWPFPVQAMAGFSAGLIALFLVTGTRAARGPAFAEGSAHAGRILAGEWWRALTALTLHADLGHVIGNALSGFLFVGFLARRLGFGLALSLCVAAGATGNLLNAWLHQARHDSVGASTAIFAAVGGLAALVLPRRSRRTDRPWVVSVGAGLGILAMLGTGERADLWAHFFGLASGFAAALPLAWRLREPPPERTQWAAAGAALLALAGAWWLALG